MVGSPASIPAAVQALLIAWIVFVIAAPSTASDPNADPNTDWTCRQKICQRVSRRGLELTLELRSERSTPTYVVLTPEGLSNVKALQPPPSVVRLEPGQTKTAGVLAIEDPDAPHAYQTSWRTLSGNPFAVHDDRWHYRMPFGGSAPVTISQGYDAKASHRGLGAYALDFPVPSGTPVLAARGGTIARVIDDQITSSSRSGENEGDNRVVIEHVDGTFAVYAHLCPGGSARVGQRVRSGERIGLSGNTGFSTGPHLHFEVYKIRPDGKRETLPVRFWNGTKAGFTARAGVQYEPGCPRDGATPCRPGELADEPVGSR